MNTSSNKLYDLYYVDDLCICKHTLYEHNNIPGERCFHMESVLDSGSNMTLRGTLLTYCKCEGFALDNLSYIEQEAKKRKLV